MEERNSELKTYIDLYTLWQNHTPKEILDSEKDEARRGWNLEASLNLLPALVSTHIFKEWSPTIGNFNLMTIEKMKSFKDLFYTKSGVPINFRGNGGNASDCTFVSTKDDKHLLIFTSKINPNISVGQWGLKEMMIQAESYIKLGYKITYGFCTTDKKILDKKMRQARSTSESFIEPYFREDTIVIDLNDLQDMHIEFKRYLGDKSLDSVINFRKKILSLMMHQRIAVLKILRLKNCNKKQALLGHIQRSGKTYTIAGCIIEDCKNKDECNYFIITTAPKETFAAFKTACNCLQLDDFEIILLDGKNKNPICKKKNIIICSKQFLQDKIKPKDNTEKTKNIPWLKKIKFEMRFVDECHHGGTTPLAKTTLKYYGGIVFTVYCTATYCKPIYKLNIPEECRSLWDMECIKLCKNINIP